MSGLLEVRGLTVELPTPAGRVPPVNEVSLRIAAGESLGLVGESGSGKTMLSLALMGLLPPGARVSGEASERVAVMYAGRIIEEGPAREVLAKPRHPYTQGLLKASPTLKRGALTPIPGSVPQLTVLPPGCAFEPRCELRRDECASAIPALRIIASDHAARCILV
jgi:oligopeptide/dipeptide ABC transporter ATP-binding protein